MTRKFPRKIVVKPARTELTRFFFGRKDFHGKVGLLLQRGLKEKNIFDIVKGTIQLEFKTIYYNFYAKTIHSAIINFKCESMEGVIEVKHVGFPFSGGQIEHVVITITKCEVPKVIFTYE